MKLLEDDSGFVAFDTQDAPSRTDPVEIVRRLVPGFARRAARQDRAAAFPRHQFEELTGHGIPALSVPLAQGGGGHGLTLAREVIGIVAEADPSVALILAMQFVHQAGIARSAGWPADLAGKVQRAAASEGALLNILRVEPELGSPARGGLPETTARRTAEGWSVSGRKIYSTGSTGLAYGLVWARTEDDEPRVGLFLVPMSAHGIWIEETWDALGMRATASHDVVLENVAIPLDHAVDLRAPAAWLVPDPDFLVWNTTLIAAVYDGVARAAQAAFASFLRERVPSNLGTSLAHLPRFQEAVGENERLLFANRRLLDDAARAADAGAPPTAGECGFVKLTVTENAIAVVQRAVELTGNPGLSRGNPLERHLRDVLCARIHTPQGDSVRIGAGRAALGI